jgi:hypothetical protein
MIGFGYESLYNHHRRGKEEKGKENGCERKDGAALKQEQADGYWIQQRQLATTCTTSYTA